MRLRAVSAVVGVTVALAAPRAARADCIDYGDYIHLAGTAATPGPARAVAVEGSFAYVAADTAGLQIIDVSSPAAPFIVGALRLPGRAREIAVGAGHAYVAADTAGLFIVEVRNPAAPALAGRIRTPGPATDVALAGRLACVAGYDAGLAVIDVSEPAAPGIAGVVDTPGFAMTVEVEGGFAFIADLAGLDVIDLADPAAPVVAGVLDTPGEAWAALVEGNRAYVTGSGGLHVIDVSNPTAPVLAATVPAYSSEMAVAGGLAYLGGFDEIRVIDVSDPGAPAYIGGLTTESPEDIALAGDFAFTAGYPGLAVIDAANPRSPPVLGRLEGMYLYTGPLAAAGTRCYVTGGYPASFQVVDLADPASPSPAGSVGVPGSPSTLAASGNLACGTSQSLLWVVDAADPEAPVLAGTLDLPAGARDLAMAGSLACVAVEDSTVRVIDLAVPGAPALVATIPLPGPVAALDLALPYLHVAARARTEKGGEVSRLTVIDLTDPRAPAARGSVDSYSYYERVTVAGRLAFVSAARGAYGTTTGLQVVDISDPAAPAIVGELSTPARPRQVAVVGGHVYAALGGGFWVVDVSLPSAPALVGGYDLAGGGGVAATPSCVLLSDWTGLLTFTFQCGTPSPVELSRFEAAAEGDAIAVRWATAFESDLLGFHVHRTEGAGGRSARLTAAPIAPGAPYELRDRAVEPGTTYLYRLEALDRSGGSQLFGPVAARAEGAGAARFAFALAPSAPNPFRAASPWAEIAFELPHRGRAALRLFDAAGRLVRVLADGTFDAGEHVARWDGRNEGGEEVGSAVYFYRLEAGGAGGDGGGLAATRRLVRIR